MSTYSMGFTYEEGKKVGYDILFPNGNGSGSTLLPSVSAKDRTRIVREIKDLGHSEEDITVERVEL